MKNPPAIDDDLIVFTSSPAFSGNPKALFQYMIDNGYNQKYKMVWLFERPEDIKRFDIPNVNTGLIWNKKGIRKPYAQTTIMSAKYIFYSHNVNWARKYMDGQTFINLWHGCGYKADMKSDKKKIHYDYLMVTGKKYIDIFKDVLKDPEGNVLDLGYPRNEMLTERRSGAASWLDIRKVESSSSKSIIWMPTYRKSRLARLDMDTGLGDMGLPIICDETVLKELNNHLKEKGVLCIVKHHNLQSIYEYRGTDLSNIIFADDEYLNKEEIELYELLGQTDALITDYSSVAIDYMLTDKPIAYTLDDYDRYEDARGWSFENVKDFMPGHHIYNIDELKVFINDIAKGNDPHKEWRHRVKDEAHTYIDGFSKRILDYFEI